MKQVTVSVKTDKQVKEDFNAFCEDIGLNMSSAINIFMRTVLREQKIPFEIGLNTPNSKTRQVLDDIETNKNLSRTFSSVDELMEDLNANLIK